jgi:hypothetical protein
MDLSEARGLVLFRVVRGGIGISQRLGAIGTVLSNSTMVYVGVSDQEADIARHSALMNAF